MRTSISVTRDLQSESLSASEQSDSESDRNAEDEIPYSNVDWARNGQKWNSLLKNRYLCQQKINENMLISKRKD